MFSKRLLTIVCLILFALSNVIFLSISAEHRHGDTVVNRMLTAAIAPFQEGVVQTIRFCEFVWEHYFYLVSAREECDRLRAALDEAAMERGRYLESQQQCAQLKRLLETKEELPHKVVSARVVGLDPSPWYKTIIINRGTDDGVQKGNAVMAPEGLVGQVVSASFDYAQVMLMIDRSSAIDALIQRNRTRGIVEGQTDDVCRFKYVVRKADVAVGDVVVSSGLDRIFPKGLPVGTVQEVGKTEPGIFQEVTVAPFVDFARLEQVLVIVEEPAGLVEPPPETGREKSAKAPDASP